MLRYKKLLSVLLSFLLLALSFKFALAQQQFFIGVSVEYQVDPSGTTTVTHNVNLENATSEYFAKSYTLSLENIHAENISAHQGSKSLVTTTTKDGSKTNILINFDDSVVGKGASRNFSIVFTEKSFVVKTGEVWEISIPRLADPDNFGNYNVTLLVPTSFGREAYLTPSPIAYDAVSGYTKYTFAKENVARVGISAGFGEFQVFDFNLKYHLENPLGKAGITEIALPPDTAFQKVYYDNISPAPKNVRRDRDGNWLASYELSAREQVNVVATGHVQIFSKERTDLVKPSKEFLNQNLQSSAFWQTEDPKIRELARTLKTPKAIYDYVAGTLKYDYARVRPNVDRLGATTALTNPNSAICMEFTDLFVAIARAAGIPAREVNGYAYTENPEIEPLSLVADVLHAWPEYWDEARGIWVPVDPTWGSTTGGVDFFNQMDLRHFAFVMHGESAERPYPAGSYKLGSSPEKDVFVSFGELPKERAGELSIVAEVKNKIPLLPPKVTIKVKNVGESAIYDTKLDIFFDNKKVTASDIPELLPFSVSEHEVKIPYSILAINQPDKIVVTAGEKELVVDTARHLSILYNLVTLLVVLGIIVLLVLVRAKRIKLPNVKSFRKNTSN